MKGFSVGRHEEKMGLRASSTVTINLEDVEVPAENRVGDEGVGFKIAMRDLEIRGAGNILGSEQSGHIASIGYELYCRLLEQSVRELTHEAPPPAASRTSLEIGIGGMIPRPYIPSDVRRLEAYRRIATASSREQLDDLASDLTAAYGDPPPPVQRLLDLAEIRAGASALGIRAVVLRSPDVIFRTPEPSQAADAFATAKGTVRTLDPKSGESLHEVYYRPPASYLEPGTLVTQLRHRLGAALP
ncbi:MAG: TRCF domain-containing protein [Planctomycetota bacterium]